MWAGLLPMLAESARNRRFDGAVVFKQFCIQEIDKALQDCVM